MDVDRPTDTLPTSDVISDSPTNQPTNPPTNSADTGRRRGRAMWLKAAQWLFVILVVVFVLNSLRDQWHKAEAGLVSLRPEWLPICAASLIVLAVYALLIHAWRYMQSTWGTTMPYGPATRIWFASSLGKYLPGYVWSFTAMGVMAREQGTSPVAAAGSSVVIQLLNIASGIVLVLMCGAGLIPNPFVAGAILIGIVGAALSTPAILPRLGRLAARITGRNLVLPQVSPGAVWRLLVWTALAWIGYGMAYQLFALGLIHHAGSRDSVVYSPLLFIAVYTAAYIAGFLAPTPAGLGTRESVLVAGFSQFHLMSASDALIVALASRLWLTVLEVVPGVIALVIHQTTHRTRST